MQDLKLMSMPSHPENLRMSFALKNRMSLESDTNLHLGDNNQTQE